MSESVPSSAPEPIQGFTESFKSAQCVERILSLCNNEYMEKLRVSAWTVRWVLSVRRNAKPIRVQIETAASATYMTARKGPYVVDCRLIELLLDWPKPAFDALAIELPCLMGFRAKEVTTWRAEWTDEVLGETLVLDAKKHALFRVPLSRQVARHRKEVLNGRCEGLVLQSRSNRQQDPEKPLTPIAVWYRWNKWIQQVIGSGPGHISPVVGRRYLAYKMYHEHPEDLVELQVIMRHSTPETTLEYVRSLVSWKDVKRAYDRFQQGLEEKELISHV